MTTPKKDKSSSTSKDDVMHDRSFAGADYGANEREQTLDIERTVHHPPSQESDDSDEITDAEMEVREANGGA